MRPKNAQDGPTPSANGTLAAVAAALWHLTGDDAYRTLAEEILGAFAGDARASPGSHATLLLAATMLAEPVQIVVVGDEATPGFAELFAAAAAARRARAHPAARGAGSGRCRRAHPAAGKRLLDGRAAAYVCIGSTCEAPLDRAGSPGATAGPSRAAPS